MEMATVAFVERLYSLEVFVPAWSLHRVVLLLDKRLYCTVPLRRMKWQGSLDTRPGNSGKYLNFSVAFSGLEIPWNGRKSWKSVNPSNKVFLKDIEEQSDGKIQQLCNIRPGKKLSEAWESPGNLFLKKGTNPEWVSANSRGNLTYKMLEVESDAAIGWHSEWGTTSRSWACIK